eukprot:5344373-Karenia_brevis.AAC.1
MAALVSLREFLPAAGPRVVTARCDLPPIVIFTDGALECGVASVGAVKFQSGQRPQCFGGVLTTETWQSWKSREDQEQVICQCELCPVLLAKTVWECDLADKRAIFFVDNEPARFGLIKAYSPCLASLQIIQQCSQLDYRMQSRPWYARVPSSGNIADAPSRMEYSEVMRDLRCQVIAPPAVPGIVFQRIL